MRQMADTLSYRQCPKGCMPFTGMYPGNFGMNELLIVFIQK
jgi:hypothetical protein